jgi:hypothetical protein
MLQKRNVDIKIDNQFAKNYVTNENLGIRNHVFNVSDYNVLWSDIIVT